MKCPICLNETVVVYRTDIKRDGQKLWGCSECGDGEKKTFVECVNEPDIRKGT